MTPPLRSSVGCASSKCTRTGRGTPIPTGVRKHAGHSQDRFARVLDIAEDAIVSVDAAQRIVLFNQGAERAFGFTAAEILGRPLNLRQRHERPRPGPERTEDRG